MTQERLDEYLSWMEESICRKLFQCTSDKEYRTLVLDFGGFCFFGRFAYRVKGKETPNPLLQNNTLSDVGHIFSSFYFDR